MDINKHKTTHQNKVGQFIFKYTATEQKKENVYCANIKFTPCM